MPVKFSLKGMVKSRIVRNVLSGTGLRLVGTGVSLLAVTYLARTLGPRNYGRLNISMAVVSYFSLFMTVGLPTIGIREIARNPRNAKGIWRDTSVIRTLLCIVSFAALMLSTYVISAWASMRILLIPLGLEMFVVAVAPEWVFLGQERAWLASMSLFFQNIVMTLGFLWLVHRISDLNKVPWIMFGAASMALVLLLIILYFDRYKVPNATWGTVSAASLFARLRQSAPFLVAGSLSQVYSNVDVIALGYVQGDGTAGQYGVAYRVVAFLLAFIGMVNQTVYPVIARFVGSDNQEMVSRVIRSAALAVFLPTAVGGTLLSVPLIQTLFGTSYRAAAAPFSILLWYVLLSSLSINYSNSLLAAQMDRVYAIAVGIGATVDVAAISFMIPLYGATGAALAMVGAEICVLGFLAVKAHRRLGMPFIHIKESVSISVSTCVMGIVVWRLDGHIFVVWDICIGVVSYLMALMGTVRIQAFASSAYKVCMYTYARRLGWTLLWLTSILVIALATGLWAKYMVVLVATLLAVALVLRLRGASSILVLGTYAFSANTSVTSVRLGPKTLSLSAGDLVLLAVASILLTQSILDSSGKRSWRLELPAATWRIAKPMCLLGAVFLISTLLMSVLYSPLHSDLPRSLLFYVRWLAGPILFVMASKSGARTRHIWPIVIGLFGCLFVGILISVPGGIQVLLQNPLSPYVRFNGLFPGPNQMGQVGCLLLVVVLSLSIFSEKWLLKVFSSAMAVVLVMLILYTQSRESITALAVSLVVMAAVLIWKRLYLWACIVLGSLSGAIVVILNSPRVLDTISQLQSGEMRVALNGRMTVWHVSLHTFLQHWWSGIGFDNLQYVAYFIEDAHNGLLQAGVVSGVWGMMLYLYLLWSTGSTLFQSIRKSKGLHMGLLIGLASAFVGYVVTSIVSDHFITFYIYDDMFWGLSGVAFAILTTPNEEEKPYENNHWTYA